MVAFEDDPILTSSYPSIPIPELETLSACEYLLNSAKENVEAGRTKWLTDTVTGETLNFSDADPLSRSVASAMTLRGLKKGDICLYLTTDVTKIFAFTLGVWRCGGVMYSSYPEDTMDTLLKRIQDSKIKWVLCDPVSVEQVKEATEKVEWDVEILVFLRDGDELPEGCTDVLDIFKDDGSHCPDDIFSSADLDDPLLILCTSGTTGKSKGALYTNLQVLAFTIGTSNIPYNEKPAMLVIRCTHVLGMLFPIRNLKAGVWSVLMHDISKEEIFRAVDTYKPQLAFGFATFLALLSTDPDAQKIDRSSLEVIITGGMVITEKFFKDMMKLPNVKCVFNGYGMTECAALTTTIDLSGLADGYKMMPNIPPLSCGKLYPNTSLKVLDLDTGKSLGPNKQGEIVVSSPIMCSGYWKLGEEEGEIFDKGWMRTGDLGYYDDNGFVYVVDRIKETFKYFNCHISPAELEEIILQHPSVEEAVVAGIPDPNGGDRIPRAFVVLKPGMREDSGSTAEMIREFTDAKVASYKKLRGGLFILDSFPRNKTGKVARGEVLRVGKDGAAAAS